MIGVGEEISLAEAAAAALEYQNFHRFQPKPWRPAPQRIKSYVAFYSVTKNGTLCHVNYAKNKGKPRQSWTYRAARRNTARGLGVVNKLKTQ